MKYACIDPNDPHAASLSKLSLKGLTILAWPTQQVKPMYEYCDVKLCNGEEFMCSEIIPLLPSLIAEDPDGSASKPFLMELHAYCCKDDRASNVRQIASDTAFVPSEDLSRMAEPRSFTSPAGSAAGLFREVLSSHLPVGWMASNLYMMELLQQLGMEMVLTPPLILLCAQETLRLSLPLVSGKANEANKDKQTAGQHLLGGHPESGARQGEDEAAEGILEGAVGTTWQATMGLEETLEDLKSLHQPKYCVGQDGKGLKEQLEGLNSLHKHKFAVEWFVSLFVDA
ncbi:unnamed protein product [Prorocentrum cordatum]|uniref:Uncharacterized protein n=1 Tax=Prorocentrum cordatum TaxID=2364126 RepID=A0ABN9Y682_9DINO|nr:unnamed protein product [Polarella glacialis]